MANLSQLAFNSTTYNFKDTVSSFGGTNLLQGTAFKKSSDLNFYAANQNAQLSIENNTFKVLNGQTSSTPGFYYKSIYLDAGTYVFSCKIKSVTSNGCNLSGAGIWTTSGTSVVNFTGTITGSFNNSSSWTEDIGVANLSTAGTYRIYFFLNANGKTVNDGVYIKDMQVERGNKPTGWTPAPKDLITVSGGQLQIFR